MFTTKQEVNDPLIFWGFAGAAVLNAVLAAQMVMYWRGAEERDVRAASSRRSTEVAVVEPAPAKPGLEDSGTPGRRWARKLD